MWIDLQMSLADIEAEIPPTYRTSYPAYQPWVMQWANVGLKGAIDDALNLKRMSGRSGAVSSVTTRRFPDASVHLAG